MAPITGREHFKAVFLDVYKANLGHAEPKRILRKESSLDTDFPVLIYEGEFEKYDRVLITVNFMNEDGNYRITQVRFDKIFE